jgi:hypothetical protein
MQIQFSGFSHSRFTKKHTYFGAGMTSLPAEPRDFSQFDNFSTASENGNSIALSPGLGSHDLTCW